MYKVSVLFIFNIILLKICYDYSGDKMKKIIISLIIFAIVFIGGFIYDNYYNKTNINNNMNDIDKTISYYKDEYLTRYLNYKKANSNLSDEDIITRVNIGLDQAFYTNIKESNMLNKITILVNKYTRLPSNYVPNNLETISSNCSIDGMKMVKVAKEAFEKMCQDAKKDGYTIRSMSSYRSYERQQALYNDYVKKDGVAKADTYSARAGHSEHQTGLTTDIDNVKTSYMSFESTKEFNWMTNNAHKYGFILRYPKGKSNITGYQYEAWHYRYVGIDIATYIKEHNITYDEYYVRFIEST
jgi:D-alanyl-D-alanine carboxypeptidase